MFYRKFNSKIPGLVQIKFQLSLTTEITRSDKADTQNVANNNITDEQNLPDVLPPKYLIRKTVQLEGRK